MIKQRAKTPLFFTVLMIIALSALISPWVFNFLNGSVPYILPLSICVPTLLIVLGYALQAFAGAVFKVQRVADDGAYERSEDFYSFVDSLFATVISIVIAIITKFAADKWLVYLSKNVEGLYYDKFSLLPLIFAVFVLFCMMTGVVLWFIPPSRVVSVRNIIPLMLSFFANYVVTAIFFSGKTQLFTTFAFVVFIICAVTLLNQSNIISIFSKAENTHISHTSRFYNAAVIGVLVLASLIVLIAVLSVVVGLSVIARIVLFYTLGIVFASKNSSNGNEYGSGSSPSSQNFFAEVLDVSDSSGGATKVFFLFFFVMIIMVGAFFIISRRRDVWGAIKRFFERLSQAIVDILSYIFKYREKKDEKHFFILDYKDEEIGIDEKAVNKNSSAVPKKGSIYRTYLSRLSAIPSDSEKLKFSYRTLVSLWRAGNYKLTESDTPRQIMQKVHSRMPDASLSDLTEIFELIEYGNTDVDHRRAKKALSIMGKIIRRFDD